MNRDEFSAEIKRLEQQFGPYGAARMEILFRQVGEFSHRWFKGIIDTKLAGCRYMPLPVEFSDDVSIEREREHQRRKEQHTKDAEEKFLKDGYGVAPNGENWGGYSTDDQKKSYCSMIRDIFSKKIQGDAASAAVSLIKRDCQSTEDRVTIKDPKSIGSLD